MVSKSPSLLKIVALVKARCPLALLLRLCCAFGVCVASSSALAQKNKKERPVEWIKAVVIIDGAAVYAQPDFDSEVKDYLGFQTSVTVSKKPYAGQGGIGLFHRVRYAGSRLGYITDTDIRVNRKEAERVGNSERRKSSSKAWSPEEEEYLGKAPLYLTRFLGGALATVQFTEKFSGRKLSDNMIMYGLRMTGPGTLFDGPPLDFNFWFSMQKPGYYSKFAAAAPSGFLLFGDVMAMLPMIDLSKVLVSYGVGIMWTYTRYSVPVRKSTTGEMSRFDSQEFRVGVDFGLGAGRKFGRYFVRADAKYYIEKTSYPGLTASLQMEY